MLKPEGKHELSTRSPQKAPNPLLAKKNVASKSRAEARPLQCPIAGGLAMGILGWILFGFVVGLIVH